METSGWIQFAIYLIALALVTKPMGLYLMRVLDPNGKTSLDPVLAPVERFTYRAMGVDPRKEHDWKQYTPGDAAFQSGGLLVHLRDPALAIFFAPESAKTGRSQSRSFV